MGTPNKPVFDKINTISKHYVFHSNVEQHYDSPMVDKFIVKFNS